MNDYRVYSVQSTIKYILQDSARWWKHMLSTYIAGEKQSEIRCDLLQITSKLEDIITVWKANLDF